MGVNSLPKTVTRQRRDCDFNPGPSAPESSALTTRLLCSMVLFLAVKVQLRATHSESSSLPVRVRLSIPFLSLSLGYCERLDCTAPDIACKIRGRTSGNSRFDQRA